MLKVEREVTALKRHRLRRPEFLSNVQNSTVDSGEERTPLKTKSRCMKEANLPFTSRRTQKVSTPLFKQGHAGGR